MPLLNLVERNTLLSLTDHSIQIMLEARAMIVTKRSDRDEK